MKHSLARIRSEVSLLIAIDWQDRLLAKIPNADAFLSTAEFLIEIATLLGVPILATEQYPKGLGPTSPRLREMLPVAPIAKTSFSSWANPEFQKLANDGGRKVAILTGVETHVCIAQTAFDLLQNDYRVVIVVDAVGSRIDLDHKTAIARLAAGGVTLTTAEALVFEWLADATHPHFKVVSQRVIARTTRSTGS